MRTVNTEELFRTIEDRRTRFEETEKLVAGIIRNVRENGESALRELTKTYDGVDITDFRVSKDEIKEAQAYFLTPEWKQRLKKISARIRAFAKKELPRNFKIKEPEGTLERIYVPIEPIGVYIPAGTAPLVSTVLMAMVPAQTAGVRKIVVATPPGNDGKANKAVVATCAFLGVLEIYKIGGSQAIAALAYGVGGIPKSAKIVGPGNEYVAAAKKLLYGTVDIDCPAGPSEVVVFADKTAPLPYIFSELAGQAEHRNGLAILLTPDRKVADAAKNLQLNGFVICAKRKEASNLIERIAPEHLVIMAKDGEKFAAVIKNSGAVFVGKYSPVALGDYLAGPSHILPTAGAAASFSGLSALTFLRSFARISWNKNGLRKWAPVIKEMAELEGLPHHKESVRVRLRS